MEEEEKTKFEKWIKGIKETIFDVLFVMLNEENNSKMGIIITLIVDLIQILEFPFSGKVSFPWRNDLAVEWLQYLINAIQFVPWLTYFDSLYYMIIFYTTILLVILVILDIFYVSYSFSQKKFNSIWPLKLLRSVVSLFVTVLFLPILEVFVSMIDCSYIDGEYKNNNFDDIICWEGTHIIHAIFSIIVSILFMAISLVVALTYFENNPLSKDPSARVTARVDVIDIINKIIFLYVFTLLAQDEYKWGLIGLLLTCAIVHFVKVYTIRPFYNYIVNQVLLILSGTFVWTNLVLLLSMILEDTAFSGGIILFFVGLIVVCALLAVLPNPYENLIHYSFVQIEEPDKIMNYIQFVISVQISDDPGSDTVFQGYVAIHEENCPNIHCFLKKYRLSLKTMRRLILEGKREEAMKILQEQQNAQLPQKHIQQLYMKGIEKCPDSSKLRIAYAMYLLRFRNNKFDAILQLKHAVKLDPAFDEQFIIHRYIKIISEEMSKVEGKSESEDVISMIAYSSHRRMLRYLIERASDYETAFWGFLLEDEGNLGDFAKIGCNVNQTITRIESYWHKMQQLQGIALTDSVAYRLYGNFLIKILNDTEKGNRLLHHAKECSINQVDNHHLFQYNSIYDVIFGSSQSATTGCILASFSEESFGLITRVNTEVCRMLGYSKESITGKNIWNIVPHLLEGIHSKMMGERIPYALIPKKVGDSYALHNNGYLINIHLVIKELPSGLNDNLCLVFLTDPKLKSLITPYIILTDNQLNITDITSNCFSDLNISLNMIKEKKVKICKFIPTLEEDKSRNELNFELDGLDSTQAIECKFPIQLEEKELIEDKLYKQTPKTPTIKTPKHISQSVDQRRTFGSQNSKKQYLDVDNQEEEKLGSEQMKCSVIKLVGDHLGQYGYQVSLLKLSLNKKSSGGLFVEDVSPENLRGHNKNTTRFEYDPIRRKYLRSPMYDEASPHRDWATETHSRTPTHLLLSKLKTVVDQPITNEAWKPCEYAQNVTTKRIKENNEAQNGYEFVTVEDNKELIPGMHATVESLPTQDEEDSEEEISTIGSSSEMQQMMISKKTLNYVLSQKITHKYVKILYVLGAIFLLFWFILAIILMLRTNSLIETGHDNVIMAIDTNKMEYTISAVLYHEKNLMLVADGRKTTYPGFGSQQEYVLAQKNWMLTKLDKIADCTEILLADEENSKIFQEVKVILAQLGINGQIQHQEYSFREALTIMTAGIYSITKLELELIKIDEIEVYGTYTNGLNSLQIATRKVVKKLKDQVFEYLDDNYETTRIFGIVILAIFILDLITTFILFYACDNAKNTFLLLFYKIPYNYLLQFQRQSQSFKIILMNDKSLSIENNDQNEIELENPDNEEIEEDEELAALINTNKKGKKRAKKKSTYSYSSIIIYSLLKIIYSVLLGSLFVFVLIYSSYICSQYEDYIKLTENIDKSFLSTMSSTRAITEYIAPSGDFLVNGVPPKKATIDYLESFEENFSLNNFLDLTIPGLVTEKALDRQKDYISKNMCPVLISISLIPNNEQCLQFGNGILTKGLLYALAKYKETYIPTYYAFESKADIIESISENESEEENSNELLMRAIKEYADLFKLKLEQENLPKTTAVYKQYFYENTLQSEEMMREILDKFENKTDIIVVALAGINSVNAQNLELLNNYILGYKKNEYLESDKTQEEIKDLKNYNSMAFGISVSLTFLAFFIIWYPLSSKLKTELWQIRSLLSLVPAQVIHSVPKLQKYAESLIIFANRKNQYI